MPARVLLLSALAVPAFSADDAQFFESKVRPLFAARCVACHSARQRMGGLDLTSPSSFKERAARLIDAVGYAGRIKMPPTGKLAVAEIEALREWIAMGAPWPLSTPARATESHWAFQPLRAVPETPKALRIAANPPADGHTLLRRATYDLTGLPPTESEIREFLADTSPQAFARVIDRLLASPRYGEKWGRHWLDVARYADSTGADEDHRYPHAWRYRDYVIDAFNADLPYDQFVREQIAGDLLPAADGGPINARGIVATGFLALGPKLIAEQDKPKMFYDIVDEQIDVTGRAFLGLTIACARCHDHKFDPISTKDYYSLASIFASTRQLSQLEGTVSKLYFAPLVPREQAAGHEEHQKKIEAKQKEIDAATNQEQVRFREKHAARLADYMMAARAVHEDSADAGELARTRGLERIVIERFAEYLKPGRDRRIYLESWQDAAKPDQPRVAAGYQERFLAAIAARKENGARFFAGDDRFFTEVTSGKGPLTLPDKDRDSYLSEATRAKLASLRPELEKLKASSPPEPPLACAVAEGENVEQHVFVRGNPSAKGDPVPKRFPSVLAGDSQSPITRGSGRLELAHWIAKQPLTARVMANRIWQWHFGEGVVRTPSNYGKLGEQPTDPELLDYLAARFIDSGYSIKAMHRMIMLSPVYQMSSLATNESREKDPDNRRLTRFPQRRLTVEEIRDSLLSIDGSLDLQMGGGMQKGEGTDKEFSDDRKSPDPDRSVRRTIYLPLRRSNLPSLLNLFDFGDATTTGEGRSQTNVAPQALFMMNSAFVEKRARALAALNLPVDALYLRVLGRPPSGEERTMAEQFRAGFPGESALLSYCRALIASNDFLYVH